MEKRNSQLEHGHPIEQTRGFFARVTQVWLAVNNKTGIISLLANEVDNENVLHGQASFSAVKQRASDTLIGYLPIFQMLPKTSLCIRYHWYPFE